MTALQDKLSPREFEAASWLVRGLMNKEIAEKMRISPRTVEDYRSTIFRKAELRNVVELVRAFYEIEDVGQ